MMNDDLNKDKQAKKIGKSRKDRRANRSDEENLLIAYRNGSEQAFDRIINEYGNQLYNFILRLVGNHEAAEDIFQDTFVRVLRNIERYKPSAKLLTWLIQIAKNLSYDYFKKERLRVHQSLSIEVGSEEYSLDSIIEDSNQPPPQELMILEEDRKLVREAIEKLSVKKKEVILLRIYESLPYRDISEITGDPEGTLKYRVYEAVREIAAYIEKKHTPRSTDDK
ncbi:MAG: sigma-70 family RNA polymerase sigma factor [Planctomycetes bacterium]|nr:sigma-70 family RNA polymerase sigma factor [Planctomycetota bacterium]